MGRMSFGPGRRASRQTRPTTTSKRDVSEVVQELKSKYLSKDNYRERSLAIHGLICARCGREFTAAQRHLLTVHHKDGNHLNNPPDGSNWENLCIYCHEDIHSRELLGDYLSEKKE
jgi:predicted HNH restriction endonuclease